MKEKIKEILLKLNLLVLFRELGFIGIESVKENRRKQGIILAIQHKFPVGIFIETGTYLGDMVQAVKNDFKKIFSIELSSDLYKKAVKRFTYDPQVTIMEGNSEKVLPHILSGIDEPCLFWLDAHYSASITARGDVDTPIIQELNIIFGHKNKKHVIVIDDARLFTGKEGYPTLAAVQELVQKQNTYNSVVSDDMIKIYPLGANIA